MVLNSLSTLDKESGEGTKNKQNTMESRIENLEMLSMEQESTIETLNREVHRQQQQIHTLEIQLNYLKEKIDSISKEESLSPEIVEEAPPPHY